MRTRRVFGLSLVIGVALLAGSCGAGGSPPNNPPPQPISIQISPSTLTATQDGAPASLNVTVTRPAGNTNSVTLNVAALSFPTGLTTQFTEPGTGNTGTITFNASAVAAGTYQLNVNATDGQTTATANLTLTVAIVATVQNTVNTSAGLNGLLYEFMSTSFQPAEWDDNFFTLNPGATTTLNNLHPQHIRLQPVSAGTPQKDANTWDFSTLDAILDPVIGVADKSPELQIAVAPSFMRNGNNGPFLDPTYQQFAQYCANLVKYYNTTTGFVDGSGKTQVHSTTTVTPITWWGIFNEPNINGVLTTPTNEYTKMYNAVVPAMQAAGSVVPLKFVAVELADFGSEPQNFLPPFVSGVTAQVDAVATHYYASCNQSDPDASLFAQVTQTFVPHVQYIYSALQTNPALAHVPVWVTENNVNADYSDANGNSTCNPGHKFVVDQRGTSTFFAAWRPYVFSQLGKVGNQALYQWDFGADQQYGEVDFNTGKTYLSYWVDGVLDWEIGSGCPLPGGTGLMPDSMKAGCIALPGAVPDYSILNASVTETSTVEVLVAEDLNGYIKVMIANHAVHAPTDNNGPGDPRTVAVDLSAFVCGNGNPIQPQLLTIDATTDPSARPTPVIVTASPRAMVTLNGYGVAFLGFSSCQCGCPASAVN